MQNENQNYRFGDDVNVMVKACRLKAGLLEMCASDVKKHLAVEYTPG